MKLHISKIFSLLIIFALTSGLANAVPPGNPACTPVNNHSISEAFNPIHASGGVTANYTLRFNPSSALKNQMQTYINYLHAMNPAITNIIIHWRIGAAGTGNTPPPGNGGVVPGAGEQWTDWARNGNGNQVNGPANFWNGYPLKVDHWYNIYTGTYLNNGNQFFSNPCAHSNFYVRFQVQRGSGNNGQLQISDGKRILKTIPVRARR